MMSVRGDIRYLLPMSDTVTPAEDHLPLSLVEAPAFPPISWMLCSDVSYSKMRHLVVILVFTGFASGRVRLSLMSKVT